MDPKAKCRHLKKLTCNGTLRRVFIYFYTFPPPAVTHDVLIHTGKGGGES